MSFKEYLKDNFYFHKPTFVEIKQNIKESRNLLLILVVWASLYFLIRHYFSGEAAESILMVMLAFSLVGITVGWGIWDDYQDWRLKHES